ncbi:hypothetical protein [Anthocerotibacter panamensis]|uniref:hypothetical protein n=1 Tax=Anthocerotibacter panamensis TaxID=2857077 RepID=UPI001C405EB6|nr:hypothetical protein [Anthocerotibacter panamensis]
MQKGTENNNEIIEVRANEIGQLPGSRPYSHLLIVYTNNVGQEFYLRGGPSVGPDSSQSSGELSGGSSQGSGNSSSGSSGSQSSSNPSRTNDSSFGAPYGNISTDYGPFVNGTPDYGQGKNTPHRVVVAEGGDLRRTYEALKVQADAIEAAGIPYNPLTTNSNSTVNTALRNVGIEPRLPAGVWAPGTDTQLIPNPLRRSSLDEQQTTQPLERNAQALSTAVNAATVLDTFGRTASTDERNVQAGSYFIQENQTSFTVSREQQTVLQVQGGSITTDNITLRDATNFQQMADWLQTQQATDQRTPAVASQLAQE